ncbi:MAG TPA: LysR substrate-binding domain-containing protein [Chloroflexota bacterium]|jgi:DNA-binding transcriptional LysR family regulator
MPDLIAAFRRAWPEAEVVLHIEPAVRIFERIHQKVVDVGFVGGPVEDQRFRVEHLALDALVLIFSPRQPFAGRLTAEVLARPSTGTASRRRGTLCSGKTSAMIRLRARTPGEARRARGGSGSSRPVGGPAADRESRPRAVLASDSP